MKLSDGLYNALKWIALVCIPALTALYSVVAHTCGFPYAPQIAEISAGVCTCIGTLIGISSAAYNKPETIIYNEDEIIRENDGEDE